MKTRTIIVNILAIICFFPAAYMALFSPMLFDSGESSRTWAIFAMVIAIPISIIISQIISWILFFRGNYKWALGFSFVPLIFVVGLIILFSISNKLT